MMIKSIKVFNMLPNESEPVECGFMLIREKDDGTSYAQFVYSESYLARENVTSIDPFNLPIPIPMNEKLGGNIYQTPDEDEFDLIGCLRDSGPDSWGRERMMRRSPANKTLDSIDFLLASGEDRVGSLSFGLQKDKNPRIIADWILGGHHDHSRVINLDEATVLLKEIDGKKLSDEELRMLLVYGSSLGGARPKATVYHDGKIWLAKADRIDDTWSHTKGEKYTMSLAKRIGLNVPETKLIKLEGRDVFLIERFDRKMRQDGVVLKSSFVSAATALQIPENVMTAHGLSSYESLLNVMKKANIEGDSVELFKRIVYNVAIGNTDDHARNHGFVMKEGSWRLSPLYDVTTLPKSPSEKHLSMVITSKFGRIGSIENLREFAKIVDIDKKDADEMMQGVFVDTLKYASEEMDKAEMDRYNVEGFTVSLESVSRLLDNFRKNYSLGFEFDDADVIQKSTVGHSTHKIHAVGRGVCLGVDGKGCVKNPATKIRRDDTVCSYCRPKNLNV